MPVIEADMQVLNIALARAKAALKTGLMVRTQTIVDLGGIGCLPAADRSRFENTPESGRDMLTSLIKCEDLESLLS